jgi:hypothetical protein
VNVPDFTACICCEEQALSHESLFASIHFIPALAAVDRKKDKTIAKERLTSFIRPPDMNYFCLLSFESRTPSFSDTTV